MASFFTIYSTGDALRYNNNERFSRVVGDDEVCNKYTASIALMMPLSLVAVPNEDAILSHYGVNGGCKPSMHFPLGFNLIRLLGGHLDV